MPMPRFWRSHTGFKPNTLKGIVNNPVLNLDKFHFRFKQITRRFEALGRVVVDIP
jgi:hypothetical protein